MESDKAEFHVEDAISKFMFNKPGLLRRGLNCEKRTYAHLKDILGEITPNCFETNCSQHKARLIGKEADDISPKELSNYIACYETIVDSIIFLDNDQQSLGQFLRYANF